MKFFLPTYEQCRLICDANDNFTFYETKHVVDGYNVSIFNYRLAMPFIFSNPVPNRSDLQAHEMRGLTFVFNEDGSLYNRYLLMHKFFNLNQSDCSCYALMKNEKIKNISYKEDGSILTFIKLPNGKIVAKTKASFEADQATMAQDFYNKTPAVQTLVSYCLNNDIIPIFEFVSPSNRVVLKYSTTNLVLIKLRNNLTGEYIDAKDLPESVLEGVSVVQLFEGFTLDDLIKKTETDTGYEGFVVTFDSGKMIKLKLQEYCNLHNLHTEDLHREDSIIYLIVNEQIDDILCQLDEGDERRKMVLELIDLVNHYVNAKYNDVTELLSLYTGDKKQFALSHRTNPNFVYAMGVINQNSDLVSLIKERLLRETYFLGNARKWVLEQKAKFNYV